MIYLDNAATTFPKPRSVIRATLECIRDYCGNPGRSGHRLSLKTSEKIYEAREAVSRFLGVNAPENVIFTENATHALNLAIKTSLKPNSHVLISDMEHNSVLRPLYALSKKWGVEFSVFDSFGDLKRNITEKLTPDTKYIISTLASNVIGREIPLSVLSEVARENKLSLIVDASQLAGHKRIDLADTPCDALCAPSHKALFGIQGAGFCVINNECERDTIYEGGSGNDSKNPEMPHDPPERFEAGTLPSPSVISLLYGIKFIEEVGLSEIEKKIEILTNRYADILSSFKNTTVYEYGNGVISFNLLNTPAAKVSELLDNVGICTRSGLHCAPKAHESIGTDAIGTVRLSFSYLNSVKEADEFYKKFKRIADLYS